MKVTINPSADIKIEWEGSVAELTLKEDFGLTEDELEIILEKAMKKVLSYVTITFEYELKEAVRYKSLFCKESKEA